MAVVLASASPRRRELLSMLGMEFQVIPARGEERFDRSLTPGAQVVALSHQKAAEVAMLCPPESVVIAADTVVALGAELLGKPTNEGEAAQMLARLSGREHRVFTGLTVLRDGVVLSEFEETRVRFRALTPREIEAYIKTGEPMDKAGAYGAQGIGALFVEGITGDFFNVMGLPLCRLSLMLKKLGVNLI